MTKKELIERHGVEWYEEHKRKCREQFKARYHADIEKARAKDRENHAKNHRARDIYLKKHNTIYKINSRDRIRLVNMGAQLDGKEVHHFKYHTDNSDASWIDDIAIMTIDEHRKWHQEHPDFRAIENII